jgi:hypothetical protein
MIITSLTEEAPYSKEISNPKNQKTENSNNTAQCAII